MKSLSIRRALKILRLAPVALWRNAVLKGCAAAIEHRSVVERARIGSLLDVGANVGQFSVLVREVSPQARIHAFEPLQKAAETFTKVFDSDPLTTLHVCGLGKHSGIHDMHISQSADSSSLLAISERQNEVFPGTAEIGVQSITVDKMSARIDVSSLSSPVFMKIDVQGFELEVLEGCDDVLQHIDSIYVECSFQELYLGQASADDVIKFLFKHNFCLSGVFNVSHDDDGECVQADMLFDRVPTEAKNLGAVE